MARAAELGYFGHGKATVRGQVGPWAPLPVSSLAAHIYRLCIWVEGGLLWGWGISGLLCGGPGSRAGMSHPCLWGHVIPIMWVDLVTLCPVKQGFPVTQGGGQMLLELSPSTVSDLTP